jgi:hypothetical protein
VAASLARLEESRAKIIRELAERDEEVARASEEERRLSLEVREADIAIKAREAEIDRVAAALLEAGQARDAAREALGSVEHRLAALQGIVRSREGNVTAARAALANAGLAERGTLLRRLRPAPGWEGAVDLLLGEDSDALLVSGDVSRGSRGLAPPSSSRLVRADWTADAAAPSPAGALGDGRSRSAISATFPQPSAPRLLRPHSSIRSRRPSASRNRPRTPSS